MTATGEKVFPRGGKNPALSKPIKAHNFSLFDKSSKKVKKKLKKKKAKDKTDPKRKRKEIEQKSEDKDTGLIVKFVDDLSHGVLHEGMFVLGIVSQVTEKIVNISLPGGLRGIVTLLNVSEFYKDMIRNASDGAEVPGIKDLFKVGEVLPCRVISVSEDDRKKFFLTLDPKSINSKMGEMEVGLVVVGSVKSEEDHGYIIDLGISNVYGFLNFEKVETSEALPVGKLVRCAVVKCNTSQGLSSVELSMLQDDLKSACLSDESSYPIHSFIPGLQFRLTVTRVMKNGVEVSYRDDESLKGYIYEDYLPSLFPKMTNIHVGTKYSGTLLYVKPLVNIPFFKVLPRKPENWIFKYGQIVKGKVIKSSRAGVTFRIGSKLLPMKCFVPFMKLSDTAKLLENDMDLDTLYPVGRVVDEIRLGTIDYMKRCYVGATDKKTVGEKYFSVSDFKVGDIVPCVIDSMDKSSVKVKIGNVTGIVDFMDLTDIPISNPSIKFKVGQKVEGRVMEVDTSVRLVRLTMKRTLLDRKLPLLTSYEDAKQGVRFTGTIFRVNSAALTVKFFNGVRGVVPKDLTPYRNEPSLTRYYIVGQLVKCYVVSVNRYQLGLSLISLEQMSHTFKIGEKYEVVVSSVEKQGLIVHIRVTEKDEPVKGLIPCELICDYPGLGSVMLKTYTPNQKLTACHVFETKNKLPVFAISDTIIRFYDILGKEEVDEASLLEKGRIYPFLYKHYNEQTKSAALIPLLPNSGNRVFYVELKNVSDDAAVRNSAKLPIRKYQVVHGAISYVSGRFVSVSLKLSDVWDKNFHTSLDLLDVYVDCMKRLVDHHRETKEKYIRKVTLGSLVSSSVPKLTKNCAVYEVGSAVVGTKTKSTEGETITGRVVWIRGERKLLCVNTTLADDVDGPGEGLDSVDAVHRAKIVYIGQNVIVAVLKGKGNGTLVFLPRRRHVNDFQHPDSPYEMGCLTKVWVDRGKLNNLVAIDREVTLLEEKKIWRSYENELRNSMKSMKRKLPSEKWNGKTRKLNEEGESDMEVLDVKLSETVKEEEDGSSDDDVRCEYVGEAVNGHIPTDEIKQEEDSEMEDEGGQRPYESAVSVGDAEDMEIKSECDSEEEMVNGGDKDIYSKERILLSSSSESDSDDDVDMDGPGGAEALDVGFNWDVVKNRELLSGANLKPEEESSDDEEDESAKKKKRKVRLTKSEKEELAKAEEERLRLIEERLTRADVEPETADDFDRALLAKPNSSALWVKYMAFHLQATEIEKARAVARRALKTIAFNEEQEKLNVWVALLNLENLYGNEDSLNKTLSEALMCNEPYHIHLHMLNVHGQSGRSQEMERLGNMLLKKFKDVENMWSDVGLAYYKVGKVETARHVLQRALPLLDKKKHVELISKFAQMENRYGSRERAQTLYETILSSFPKRVDVWSCYVDMLVKSESIDLARQVLERATSQRLPPKKMKTLFKKFIAFEERHGTPEGVERVRQSAVEYVEGVASAAVK